jgi:hypothetical protein
VRSFAVKRLQQASDDELELFLLQLVAALRYEPQQGVDGDNAASTNSQDGAGSGCSGGGGSKRGGASSSSSVASTASASSASSSSDGTGSTTPGELSPLAKFLVSRACSCKPPYSFANFLYWYLKVKEEAEDYLGRENLVFT